MNQHLAQLVELSSIDKEIDGFEPKIKAINKDLTELLEKEQLLHGKIEKINNELVECDAKIKKNEFHIAELSDKLKTFTKKSASLKTEKEIKALQLEEDISKEQIEAANEDIERLNKQKDVKNSDVNELKNTLSELVVKIEDKKRQNDDKLSQIEETRNNVFSKKQELMGSVNQKILTFYEKIRKWAKNTTVVPLRKQACYGCYMKVNDKTYAAVIKGEDITTCPHCGRILFLEKEDEAK